MVRVLVLYKTDRKTERLEGWDGGLCMDSDADKRSRTRLGLQKYHDFYYEYKPQHAILAKALVR